MCIQILKRLVLRLKKEYCSSRSDALASENEGKQALILSSMSFHTGCHQELWPRIRVGLPASNNLIKEIPHWNGPNLGF